MRFTKLADAGLYFMAGAVILAVVVSFVNQMSDGATAKEYQEHYAEVSEPIVLTASEAAEAHLAAANKQVQSAVNDCADGSCDAAKPFKAKKPVRSFGKRIRQLFSRWRNR